MLQLLHRHGMLSRMDEIWKPVFGLEGLFSVSNLGRVRSEPRTCEAGRGRTRRVPGRIRAPFTHKERGYLGLNLSVDGVHKTYDVHTLVAEAFIGPRPDGMECAHNDGNRMNCAASNLRWATCVSNNADKRLHGTRQTGERHGLSKLTDAQVLAIRADTRLQADIAADYQVHPSAISRVKSGARWGHV
jgi:hypothetical protein